MSTALSVSNLAGATARIVTATDQDGQTSTTTYDTAGRVASSTNVTGTTTYGYGGLDADGNAEHLGLPTSATVTRAGVGGALAYRAAYDAAGNLVTHALPGKVTTRSTFTVTGDLATVTYTGQVTPVVESLDPDTGSTTWTPGVPVQDQAWLGWTRRVDALARVTDEYVSHGSSVGGVPGVSDPADITAPDTGDALASTTAYGYDDAGNLMSVRERTATHTGVTAAVLDGTVDPVFPCTRREYTFDGNGNRTTDTNSYDDTSDNPAWTTTATSTGGGAPGPVQKLRFTGGVDADLTAVIAGTGEVTLNLVNPGGHLAATVSIPADQTSAAAATGIDSWTAYTEYGTPTPTTTPAGSPATTSAGGYGWYASQQRHTSTATAELTLMGVRLYNRVRGLLTATDPIPGGNTNTYTHPTDPINKQDLDGKRSWWKRNWRTILQVGLTVGCIVASAGACLAAGAFAAALVFAADWRSEGACMTWRASWLQVVVATVAVGEGSGSCRFSAERSGS